MPSRKRNQGKVRKAKQQSRPPKEEFIVSDDIEKCEHELEIPCSLDQLKCHEFVQRFLKLVWRQKDYKEDKYDNDPALEVLHAYDSALFSAAAMQYLLMSNAHIWKDDLYRKMIVKMILKRSVDKISRYNDHTISLLNTDGGAGSYAAGIIVLETSVYDESRVTEDDMDLVEAMDVETKRKVYKFLTSSNRSIIRFYISRIKCSCLDERYAKAQSLPKMSVCSMCTKQIETSKLYLCGGCKLFQYCCVECQTAAWKGEHHKICGRRKSSPVSLSL